MTGDIYVFVALLGTSEVRFYIDDVGRIDPASEIEYIDPFDLGKTAPDDTAWPYDTSVLAPGSHTLTVEIIGDDGTLMSLQSASFTVI